MSCYANIYPILLLFLPTKTKESVKRINTCNVFLNYKKNTFERSLSRKHLIKSISSSNKIFKKSICKAFTYISYVQIILYGLQGSENEVSANNF